MRIEEKRNHEKENMKKERQALNPIGENNGYRDFELSWLRRGIRDFIMVSSNVCW